MCIRYHLCIRLLAGALFLPVIASAITTTGQYTVTILGRVQHNYPASVFNAFCVNDNGVVAGNATVRVPDNATLTERGVIYQSTIHYTILGTISEVSGPQIGEVYGFDSNATWINNSGIAVGVSAENTSHGYIDVPVIFTPNGIIDLGIKNAAGGAATCINNNSQVVGNLFFAKPVPTTQAFLYQNGAMTLLGYPVPTAGFSNAVAINNNGLIVGSAQFAANEPTHAACYSNGAWIDLGTLGSSPGFTASATSVNDSGTIVGTWRNDDQGGYFIYQNGVISELNAPSRPGNPLINNAGQMVLGNFVYQNGMWQDINDLDLGDGWTFSGAFGINNEGAILGIMFREANRTFLYRFALLTPVSG